MLMLCTVIAATAQTDSTEVDLMELSLERLLNVKIVTASKNVMEAGQAPATVIVIAGEQIRIRGYISLLDVIADLPDMKVDNNSYSTSYNKITVRGLEGQQKFLIMLDGVRISAPANDNTPVLANYPVNLAKQIEIIYGPSSALYGADALSGIINIITKKAEYSSLKTEVFSSIGDNGLYNGTLFASKKLSKDFILTLSGQYFYDGGVDFSKKKSYDTLWDFTSHSTGTFNTIFGPTTPIEPISKKFSAPLLAYNVYAALKAGDLEFSFFKNYSENSTAIENNPNNAVYNKDVFYGRGVNVFNMRHTKTSNKLTLVSTFTSSQYKINPKSNYRNLYTGLDRAYKYGYSSLVRGETQLDWKLSESSNLTGGAVYESFYSIPESADLQDPVKENRSIEGTLLNTKTYYRPQGIEAKIYSVRYSNAGVYLQLQQRIASTFTSTVGARYDRNSRFGSTFNPRVGVVWNATKRLIIKAMVGTAYLAPTPGASYSYYGSFHSPDSGRTYSSNFFHLPNPNLKPMRSTNMELSLGKYFGKNLNATITGYVTSVSNLIGYAADEGNTNIYDGKFLGWDVDYIKVFINQGHKELTGGSLRLEYNHSFRKGSLKAYSYLSYVDGIEEQSIIDANGLKQHIHTEVEYISNFIFKSGVELSIMNFSISPRLIWLGPQHLAGFEGGENGEARQEIDGYTLLNISLGYKISKTSLHLNIINALDEKYRAVGPNMDLNNQNTELFYGNHQDPIRFNFGIRVAF
jgi:outer membrane cobalamin receptor